MSEPLLLTKFYVPPPRPNIVLRSRLTERLDTGLLVCMIIRWREGEFEVRNTLVVTGTAALLYFLHT